MVFPQASLIVCHSPWELTTGSETQAGRKLSCHIHAFPSHVMVQPFTGIVLLLVLLQQCAEWGADSEDSD